MRVASRVRKDREAEGTLSYTTNKQALRQLQLLAAMTRTLPLWSFWGGLRENTANVIAKMREILHLTEDEELTNNTTGKYPVHIEMRARRELFLELSEEKKVAAQKLYDSSEGKIELDL